MSNIRGISDLRRQQEAQRERQRLVDNEMHPPRQYPILGYGFQLGTADEARKESFGQMLTLIFCPHFRYLSFIFIITTVQIVVYFATVFYDYDTSKFFQPTTNSLDDFGAKNPERMQENYELWRWLTPVMLHGDLLHLTFNLIMQLILGFRIEPTVGPWITITIYVLSGFGGVILSCLGSPDSLSVGASGALFGILAAMIAWIMINWSSLEHDLYRTVTLVWLVVLMIFNLLMGFVASNVDNWGHLGGMITGFALAVVLCPTIDPPTSTDKYSKVAAGLLLGLFYVGGITLFYTSVDSNSD